jgi:hypothetical protein
MSETYFGIILKRAANARIEDVFEDILEQKKDIVDQLLSVLGRNVRKG